MSIELLSKPLNHCELVNSAKDNKVVVLGSASICIAAITLLSNMVLLPISLAFSATVVVLAGAYISLSTSLLDVQKPLTSKEKLQKWFESLRCSNMPELLRIKEYILEEIDKDSEKFVVDKVEILLMTLFNHLQYDDSADDTRTLIVQLLGKLSADKFDI